MIEDTNKEVNAPNRWRLETPGAEGWKRSVRLGDPDRHLMISADCHCNEPGRLVAGTDRCEISASRSRRISRPMKTA